MLATLLALAAVSAPPDVARSVHFGGLALGAGGRLAWVQSIAGPSGQLPQKGALFVQDQGGEPLRLTACPGKDCDESSPVWSRDGRHLAFLSDGATPGQQQLFLTGGGPVARVTNVKGALADPRFSADGKALAFLFLEGVTDEKGPLATAPRETGVIGEDEQYVKRQRIAVVDAKENAGAPKLVSPADLHVYEYDWSPDGREFAATGAHGPGDQSWWTAQLFLLGMDGSAKALREPRWQVARPRFSPDGKRVAFIEGLMSDEDLVGGDIYITAREGGEPTLVTPGLHASPSSLQWVGDDELASAAWIGGGTGLLAVHPSSKKVEQHFAGDEHLGHATYYVDVAIAPDGMAAAVSQTFDRGPEIFAGPWKDRAKWTQRTHANQGLKVAATARSLAWKTDGQEVQGWLLAPEKVDAAKKHGLVVIVHGGPAYAANPSLNTTALAFTARGYFVLLPNPRGSFGQGEAFVQGNRRDFGGGDLRDLLAGVDAAVAKAPIDETRVGLWGWSYGGFMAMFAPTQTSRFKAIVAGAGITNWQSYYGTNRIDTWMIPYFDKSVYEDPAIYRRASAIETPKKLRTPTLLLHGERDSEVPVTQSFEHWHALRANNTPTQLVVYPDEGHVPQKPEHQRDLEKRAADWFDKYLK